jgi:hypothetical protein
MEARPDIAVMMHNINDLSTLLLEGTYWNRNPTRSLIVSQRNISHIEKEPFLYRLRQSISALVPNTYRRLQDMKNRLQATNETSNPEDEFAHLRGRTLQVDRESISEEFRESLQTFISICEINGIVPILMTQANRFIERPDKILVDNWTLEKDFGVSYQEFRGIYSQMNELIRETGRTSNVMVIDLAMEVQPTNEYMYDAVYFNGRGSKYVAKIIADQLRNLVAELESSKSK